MIVSDYKSFYIHIVNIYVVCRLKCDLITYFELHFPYSTEEENVLFNEPLSYEKIRYSLKQLNKIIFQIQFQRIKTSDYLDIYFQCVSLNVLLRLKIPQS